MSLSKSSRKCLSASNHFVSRKFFFITYHVVLTLSDNFKLITNKYDYIAYNGMDVQRVRLLLGDNKGPALLEKKKTLHDLSKYC